MHSCTAEDGLGGDAVGEQHWCVGRRGEAGGADDQVGWASELLGAGGDFNGSAGGAEFGGEAAEAFGVAGVEQASSDAGARQRAQPVPTTPVLRR